jgi:hypothetical protein
MANQGSGSVSLNGNAQASAAAIKEIDFQVKQPWGAQVPCTWHLFFMTTDGSHDRSAILAQLVTYVAGVLDWPRFSPRPVSIICRGAKVSIDVKVHVHATQSISTDYNGALTLQGSIRTSGKGLSYDVGLNTKVIRLPATIHPALSVVNSGAVNAAVVSSCSLSTGANSDSHSVSSNAVATISPTSIGATAGQTTIPTSGKYMFDLRTEPYRKNILKIMACVVDMGYVP